MATPRPSMSATDGALAMVTMTDFDSALVDPVWDAVGLTTDWRVDPAKEHQLAFYGGRRRLANDIKIGEAYTASFSLDVEAVGLAMYDRVTKDLNGTGTAEEVLAFACRVKYAGTDFYYLLKGALLNEVTLTIARDIVKATFSVMILTSVDILTLAEFRTATGLDVAENPVFNAPPAPEPFTHLSPGAGVIPCTFNGVEKGIISIAITHTNGVQPIRCTNDVIASGGAIGHQSVRLTITVYENTREFFQGMKADTYYDIVYKINTTQQITMDDFKINGHPIAHPQTSEDLGTIGLTLDGPAAILGTI